MNDAQWQIFCDFKTEFKNQIQKWQDSAPELADLQKQAAIKAGNPLYSFETAVVYNRDLDKLTKSDVIKLIVIGDNPGKDEQLAKNNKYLVGQAGKIAEGFFRKNPLLQTDFRKNVIILNKTPVHSAKTSQLKTIMKLGGEKIVTLIQESQIWMAQRTAKLHQDLCLSAGTDSVGPELWMVGYSELKGKGFFIPYRDKLRESYESEGKAGVWEKVFVFQHFSMNRFTVDLGEYLKTCQDKTVNMENIHAIGTLHRKEIFGK